MANVDPTQAANVQKIIGAQTDGTETNYVQVEIIDGQRRVLTETIGTITAAADQGEVYIISRNEDVQRDLEYDSVLIRNPDLSGKTVKFLKMYANNLENSDDSLVLRFYANATFSAAGTAMTANTTRVGSGSTAVATITEDPTITSRGTFLFSLSFNKDGESTNPFGELFQIAQNNNVLMTTEMVGTDREWNIEIWFDEKNA